MSRSTYPLRVAAAFTAVVGVGIAGVAIAADPVATTDPKGALSCVGPLDAAGIDAVLARAGSPLTGQGAAFVNQAAAVGLDPRALVAIAGHETILQTYGPANAIHNAFGIGPGRRFASDADAIAFAAELLAQHYVGEGRRTLAEIAGKWAPLGVANDPTNLNSHWTAGVGTLYARLGGNPAAPITLDNQSDTDCQAPANVDGGVAAPGIVAWNGTPPAITDALMELGADPLTGQAATLDGFVFPLIPAAAPIRYADDFREAGLPGCYGKAYRCMVTLSSDPGTGVAAATSGVLDAANAEEQATGLAFWIVTSNGDRFGYSGLASYADGIADNVAVTAGRLLGTSTRTTLVAWERAGQRINPFALLGATRPSDA